MEKMWSLSGDVMLVSMKLCTNTEVVAADACVTSLSQAAETTLGWQSGINMLLDDQKWIGKRQHNLDGTDKDAVISSPQELCERYLGSTTFQHNLDRMQSRRLWQDKTSAQALSQHKLRHSTEEKIIYAE